jgi:hypothetical protein
MKKSSKFLLIISFIIVFIFGVAFSNFVFAHSEDAELNKEIQRGRELIEKLKNKEINCQDLTDEDFHSIGEYAMELMVGGSDHLTMNKMIQEMHGEEAEERMHIEMGKRFSGCGGNYGMMSWMMPSSMNNFRGMPMMNMWGWNFFNWRGWNILSPFVGLLGILWLLIILSLPVLVLTLLILMIIYLIKKIKREIKQRPDL